jgi:hypothetical protein
MMPGYASSAGGQVGKVRLPAADHLDIAALDRDFLRE